MGADKVVSNSWWDATCARQGHTGWADQQVYHYDQPVRRASVRRVLARLHPRGLSGQSAIDIGCGTGDFTLMLHALGARVVGVDFSAAVLETARLRARDQARDIRFVRASCTDIPEPDASADLVTSVTVLQHLTDDADLLRAVRELARLLKPAGRLVILELAPPLEAPNRSADGHVIERPPSAWHSAFVAGGLRIESESAYPQYGITALRLMAQAIDRARGDGGTAAPAAAAATDADRPLTLTRRLLRQALWLVRLSLLALAWPLDRLLRFQVPQRYRYYRLWVLSKSAGGR